MWWFHCRDGDGAAARHSKRSAKTVSSVPAGELNEDILSSLGQLLTSSANNLGELLKMIPSVSRLSCSMTTTSDGRPVKRRRVSCQRTSTLDNLLPRSGDESPAPRAVKHVTDDQPTLSPSCFTGSYAHCHFISQSAACLFDHLQYVKCVLCRPLGCKCRPVPFSCLMYKATKPGFSSLGLFCIIIALGWLVLLC